MSCHLCSDFCCSPMSWYLPGLQPNTLRVWAANFCSWYLTAVTDVPGPMLKLLAFESLLFFTSAKCPLLDFSLNFLDLLPTPISDTSSFGIQIFPLFTYTLILLKKKCKGNLIQNGVGKPQKENSHTYTIHRNLCNRQKKEIVKGF